MNSDMHSHLKWSRGLRAAVLVCLLFAFTEVEASGRVVAHWVSQMKYSESDDGPATDRKDILAATHLGVSAFALDVFSLAQGLHVFSSMYAASDQLGQSDFKFFLSADVSLKLSGADIVKIMSAVASSPKYFRVNGRPLLSTYGGERLGNEWWKKEVVDPLRAAGIDVVFIPYFDRDSPNGTSPEVGAWNKVISQFPVADGLFNFHIPKALPFRDGDEAMGHHQWSLLGGEEALASALRSRGKVFMGTYMPYYWAVCHPARQYLEYRGGFGMRNIWESIISVQRPELVEIATWNDYSESTFVEPTTVPATKFAGAPSFSHIGFYELLKYFISWYASDVPPRVTGDAIFFFYRTQPIDMIGRVPSSVCGAGLVTPTQLWGEVRDEAYIVVAAKAPGEFSFESGGGHSVKSVAPGLNFFALPLKEGGQNLRLSRDGRLVIEGRGLAFGAATGEVNLNMYSGVAFPTGVEWGEVSGVYSASPHDEYHWFH